MPRSRVGLATTAWTSILENLSMIESTLIIDLLILGSDLISYAVLRSTSVLYV